MMDLKELQELVDFMKKNGLSELECTEKNTSVRLHLAPPAPPCHGHRRPAPGPHAKEVEGEPVPPVPSEDEMGPEVDLEELKAAAKSAARKAAQKAADGMESVAAYVKARLPEDEAPADPDAPEEPPVDTSQSLKQAGEAVWNTVKAGAVLGKAGAKRGKERLMHRFQSDRPTPPAEDIEILDEDDDEA